MKKSLDLLCHKVLNCLYLLTGSFERSGLLFELDHGSGEVLEMGFDLGVFFFVFVDLLELLDEERL